MSAMQNETGNGFLDKINLLDKLYDNIRLVDPVLKKVLEYHSKKIVHTDSMCYDVWERGAFCGNCVSMRAYITDQAQYKLEYSPHQICQITAVPTELDGQRLVVEIIKDVTESMSVTSGGHSDEITTLIDNLNVALMQDPLTGIANRRFINERLYADILTAAIRGTRFAVVIGDIDKFKDINDHYGHLAGDAALQKIAQVMQGCLRKGDWVARYGGEEFLICLYGANKEQAVGAAERVRAAVEDAVVEHDGVSLRLTMSFGVACVDHPENITAETIIGEADRNLYQAKNHGRNRVVG